MGKMENDGENENDENGGKKKFDLDLRNQDMGILHVSTYHACCRVPSRDQKHESESDTNYFF